MHKSAKLYRMDTPDHLCPYGLKSKDLLRRKGFELEDHKLRNRQETEHFKDKHHVKTTPQTFINGERIGGYDDLKEYFGEGDSSDKDTSYTPIIATFSMTFLLAIALIIRPDSPATLIVFVELFIALSMSALALQKLKDLEAFSLQFITYDILAMRRVRYAYLYAFLEAYAGIGMLAMLPAWLISPPAFFIGTVGAISVIKAVYIEKRELKCACVGGNSKVPLGFVSLTENVMMILMAVWMWIK